MGSADRRLRPVPRPAGQRRRQLAACLEFDTDFDRAGERLGTYAFLKTAEDTANSDYQRMIGRYRHAASRAAQAASFIRPEIMAIKSADDREVSGRPRSWPSIGCCSSGCCATSPTRSSRSGEKLLAMQSEMSEASNQIFRQLSDADLKWGLVKNETGRAGRTEQRLVLQLSAIAQAQRPQDGLPQVLRSSIAAHQNTLAATLGGVGAARRLLRQGPRLFQRAGGGSVSRQRAAERFTTT